MSDLGMLSNCMVDSDASAVGRARRLRRKSLVASILLEMAMLAGLLFWPLLGSPVLPAQLVVTPAPYFPRAARPQAAQPRPNLKPHDTAPSENIPPPSHPVIHQYAGEAEGPPDFPGFSETVGDRGLEPVIPGSGPEIPAHHESVPHSGPLKRGGDVMEAMLVHRVQPEYPRAATILHVSGTVLLRARIGTDGLVRELEVMSGNPILAQAALDAVRQWRYQPTRLNGQPVEVETEVTVTFVMNSN